MWCLCACYVRYVCVCVRRVVCLVCVRVAGLCVCERGVFVSGVSVACVGDMCDT